MKRILIAACVLLGIMGVFKASLMIMNAPRGVSAHIGGLGYDIKSIGIGTQNNYLVPCAGGYMLIDTGYAADYGNFIQGLEKLGIQKSGIKYVLLTHHHDDHSGFAARLIADTHAGLIVHRKGISALAGGKPDESAGMKMEPLNTRVLVLVTLQKLFQARDFGFPPVNVTDALVVEGDDTRLLRSMGVNGEILSTPGHTADSISVIMADGAVFCGDAAMNFLKLAGTRHRPIYAADMRETYLSWKRILERGVDTIYPTHGSPFPARDLADALARFSRP